MIKYRVDIQFPLDVKDLLKRAVPVAALEEVLGELDLKIVPKKYDTLHDQQTAYDELRKRTAVDCHVCDGWGVEIKWSFFVCFKCEGETQLCAYCSGHSKSCACGLDDV